MKNVPLISAAAVALLAVAPADAQFGPPPGPPPIPSLPAGGPPSGGFPAGFPGALGASHGFPTGLPEELRGRMPDFARGGPFGGNGPTPQQALHSSKAPAGDGQALANSVKTGRLRSAESAAGGMRHQQAPRQHLVAGLAPGNDVGPREHPNEHDHRRQREFHAHQSLLRGPRVRLAGRIAQSSTTAAASCRYSIHAPRRHPLVGNSRHLVTA